MNKRILNHKGITLVELLAVIVLLAVMGIFTISLIIKGTEATSDIQIETKFRDEADLLMSNFYKTMFEIKQSDIIAFENSSSNNYLKVTNDPTKCQPNENGVIPAECNSTLKKVGFMTQDGQRKLFLKDEEYVVTDPNIKILPDSKLIANSDGSYDIILNLQYRTTRGGKEILRTMDFKNTIQPF